MLLGSQPHAETCRACAEICRACEAACRSMADGDDVMLHCADVDRNCAESPPDGAAVIGAAHGGRRGRSLSARAGRPSRVLLCVAACMGSCDRTSPARVELPVDTAAGEVPFRLAGPNEAALIVAVFVNGEGPFDFVLDTGATLTCVDQELAARLNLEEGGGLAVGSGLGGSGNVRIVRIDSLRIGGTSAHDLMGCTLQLAQLQELPGLDVEGLVGLNFLKSFRVTLDFERRVLLLTAPRDGR